MLQELKQTMNVATTENGATAYKSTLNECLDFFGLAGAMRNRPNDALELFKKAFYTDSTIAVRILFYFRDVRGGQGERNLFRTCLTWLAKNDSNGKIPTLFPYIVEHGRWDDMYCLVDTPYEATMFAYMYKQLIDDMKSETPSLLGKWLKSENTSSSESKRLARKTIAAFKVSPRNYRKMLSKLRATINVLESLMSAGKWSEIKFEKLPAKASLIYKEAFAKREPIRYQEFLNRIKAGEVVAKSATLYPYELVEKCINGNFRSDDYLESAWANLPNYLKNDNSRSLAVIDVSGSMSGQPMNVAISLGLYMAERNQGHFHNHFITFDSHPKLLKVYDKQSFVDKIKYIINSPWGFNTNIEATFDLLLKTAKNHNLPQEEMPENIYIISDMEFDNASTDYNADKTALFEQIEDEWINNGYEMPHLIFWNVNSHQNQFPKISKFTTLVSGFSQSIFASTIKGLSAWDTLLDAINKYSNINY